MKKPKFFVLALLLILCHTSIAQSHRLAKGFKTAKKFSSGNSPNTSAHAKSTQVSVPGLSINYYWSTSSNNWTFNDSTIYTYNSLGATTHELDRYLTPLSSTSYTYDSKGRITAYLSQWYNSGTNQWNNSYRYFYIYDSHDQQIEYRSENWDTPSNQWKISYGQKELITYNSNNLITLQISQNWNTTLMLWEDDTKETNFIYDANGNLTQYDVQFKNGSNWENDERYQYTYASNNSFIDVIEQLWDGTNFVNENHYMNISWHQWTGDVNTSSISSYTVQEWGQPLAGQWNTTDRYNITYDAFGGNISTFEIYNGSTWISDSRYSNIYDNKFNNIGYRSEEWQTGSNSWLVDYEEKITHSYDAVNNITQSIWESKSSSTVTLQYTQKKVYSNFTAFTGIVSYNNSNQIEVSVFPNPFSSQCTFRFENAQTENDLNLKVYDIFGKEVLQTKLLEQETQIDRGNLSSGIYFYSITDKSSTLAKGKLVIE